MIEVRIRIRTARYLALDTTTPRLQSGPTRSMLQGTVEVERDKFCAVDV